MKVKIVEVRSNERVDGKIIKAGKVQLPTIHDDWRFNFKKHSKTNGAKTFILVTEETPDIIEGCLIFRMIDNSQPYMAFIEIAPHNKGKKRIYDEVAACLIAYACRLSFTEGVGDYKGWLAFHVSEEKEEDQVKLMLHYSKKYKAYRLDETTMIIQPKDGEQLINQYLKLTFMDTT